MSAITSFCEHLSDFTRGSPFGSQQPRNKSEQQNSPVISLRIKEQIAEIKSRCPRWHLPSPQTLEEACRQAGFSSIDDAINIIRGRVA